MTILNKYDMFDFYGDTATISVFNDDTAIVEFYDFDLCRIDYKEFDNETAAYNWAYKRGYRE